MNRHLPARLVLAGIPLWALSLFVACGDDIENTTINQTGVELFDSSEDLPECTDKNESDLVFVRGETSARICVDGKWVAMASDGSEVDFSCKTVELKDGSGLKIVCNGDSIGMVLNGEKGDAGASGCTITDRNDTAVVFSCGDSTITIDLNVGLPSDTAEVDSERIAISLDSLVGITQKGPFLKGSTVYLYELSDGRTLKQTNGNFTSNITSNDGRYKFTARDLVSQYAMVVVDGYYRNEVTGVSSDAPIRLKALTDMRKRSSVNVNLLTHMEFDRVYNLVTRGDKEGKKLTVKQAKRQAQKEILKLFDIELGKDTDAEDMDVFGKTDADAALLAVSVLLQGDGGSTDLSVLLTEISNAIAEKGEWKDSAAKARIADWALKADSENRLAKFRKNVADWHLGDTVPGFEKFVRNYVNVVTGLGECGGEKTPIGNFAHMPNVNSAYFAQAYDSIDVTKNSLVRFVCDEEGGSHWRIATALERDTRGWSLEEVSEGMVKKGNIDTSLTYVFENGKWRHGTDLDYIVGFGCTRTIVDSVVISETTWYKCNAASDEGSSWSIMSDFDKDMFFWNSHKYVDILSTPDSAGALLEGPFTGLTKVWEADSLRDANDDEILLKRGCISSMNGKKYDLPNGLNYSCGNTGWSKKGTFVDHRATPTTYTAVQIGNQVWMAENLNFWYMVKVGDDGSSSAVGCKCNGDCKKYGMYYTWAAAMDSAAQYSDDAVGCGDNMRCSKKDTVRGVCPEGWHLPNDAEWASLFESVGGINVAGLLLKSQTGWDENSNGLDSYSFTGLPAGYRDTTESFMFAGILTSFWSSDFEKSWHGSDHYARLVEFTLREEKAINSFRQKNWMLSVRCVMNAR